MIQNEERYADKYKITNSFRIGGKEFVIGINMDDEKGNCYLVANYESNEIFERYTDALVSPSYIEILKIYVERINDGIKEFEGRDISLNNKVITKEHCTKVNKESFEGEIIVLDANSLRPEYRSECYQIVRCTGGNGAREYGHGTSVFCKDFFSDEQMKFRRANILGILNEEHYPDWLKDKLKDEPNMHKKKKPKEAER